MLLYIEKKVSNMTFKKRGSQLYEWIISGICYLILAAALLVVGSKVISFFKTSIATTEMRQISDQALSYSGLRKDGQLPANLEILLDDVAISASDSVSGQEYGNFLQKKGRWEGGKVLDPWNAEYEYTANTDGSGKIISNGSGKNIEVDF